MMLGASFPPSRHLIFMNMNDKMHNEICTIVGSSICYVMVFRGGTFILVSLYAHHNYYIIIYFIFCVENLEACCER